MKLKLFLPALIAFFVIACSHHTKHITSTEPDHQTISDTSGDGSSTSQAIILLDKKESDGIAAEYDYLKKTYPGYHFITETMIFENNRPFDKFQIKTADGTDQTIYFDISSYYGKF